MTYIKKLVMKGFKSFARETKVDFDKYMNVIVGPNGSGKSCHASTKVTLVNGREIQIGKLIENQIRKSNNIKTLKDGIYVDGVDSFEIISLNKKTGKKEFKKISKFIKRDGEIIYKIKTQSGKEIKATGCHPVMTFKDGEIKSVLIRDLSENSLIATPREINIKADKQYPLELARLMGYIIGDGYLGQDRIEFVNQDIEVINDFKKIINRFFPNARLKERFDKNATRIYIRDKKVLRQIKSLFIKNYKKSITSSFKKIPDLFLRTNNKVISQILAGLYDTDGSIRKDIAIIEFCTKNKKLAEQMQGLLLRFGIISKIKKRVCCASNAKTKIKRDYYYLYISGKDNMNKFYKNINLKIKYKKETIKYHIDKNVVPNRNLDLLPRELNLQIKKLVQFLGIKPKSLRKKFPFLMAYIENRCLPTRTGILKLLPLFESRFCTLKSLYSSLSPNQLNLVNCMQKLNISGQQASKQIGLNPVIIMRDWATNRFNATPDNLNKFHRLIKNTFELRFIQIEKIMNLLQMMSNSDIYWEPITSIEKLPKEDYVYDLCVEKDHNFIANNIFVHNSNITDALCFVLGRLSIKSMRAVKASHLIFSGNKDFKKSNQAYVEIVFDNSDKTFSLDNNEIRLRRIVNKKGQSKYKINNETKTRQEVLELLSQAGIDPYGFNIILQGEIERFVKMAPDERRKVLEEVSGISVYEMRKSKSLKELERTSEKTRQVNAVLRERTKFLQSLEKERQQALRYKKLQEIEKRSKASILQKQINDKEKELSEVTKKSEAKKKEIRKKQEEIEKTNNQTKDLNSKAEEITKNIQKSSGLEQDTLLQELSNLKQETAGLRVKKENYENQLSGLKDRRENLESDIKESDNEIKEMMKEKGKNKKKELQDKKKKLEELEELKREYYLLKSNSSSLNNQIEDKTKQIQRLENESNFTFNQIKQIESEIKINQELSQHSNTLEKLKNSLEKQKQKSEKLNNELNDFERKLAVEKQKIPESEKIKSQVSELDICPLCKTKITKEHINEVINNSNEKIENAQKNINKLDNKIKKHKQEIENLNTEITKNQEEIRTRELDIIKLQNIEDKKKQLKRSNKEIESLKKELQELENKNKEINSKLSKIKISEEQHENLRLEVNELQRTEERDLGMEITTKQRDIDRMKLAIKQINRDKKEIQEELEEINSDLEENDEIIEKKEEQAEELKRKYQKMYEKKNSLQDKARELESKSMKLQNEKRNFENTVNNLSVEKAQINAKKDTLKEDIGEYKGIKLYSLPLEKLKQKLQKAEDSLSKIGSVNMKSLEAYEGVKKGYDKIKEKVEKLNQEKQEILKTIEKIDRKKKKVFLHTLNQINELFSRNFSHLSAKGIVTLQPRNKKDIFGEGLDISVKVGGGKYFDVTSLSGGEQSLVALSLIFAIQEYSPYCFYIFDEIDAALDKRNSEKLARLLKKYMKQGQYIIITHNDSIISESSSVLYGVSMQEGISKILSLEV